MTIVIDLVELQQSLLHLNVPWFHHFPSHLASVLLLPSSSQTMAFSTQGAQAGFAIQTSLIYLLLFYQHWNDLKLKYFCYSWVHFSLCCTHTNKKKRWICFVLLLYSTDAPLTWSILPLKGNVSNARGSGVLEESKNKEWLSNVILYFSSIGSKESLDVKNIQFSVSLYFQFPPSLPSILLPIAIFLTFN